jgi:hypothetical protein
MTQCFSNAASTSGKDISGIAMPIPTGPDGPKKVPADTPITSKKPSPDAADRNPDHPDGAWKVAAA